MHNYDLGNGVRVESLEITPTFLSIAGKGVLTLPDRLFPDIVGTLSPFPTPPPGSTRPTSMSAKAAFVLRAPQSLQVGFKQLVLGKGRGAMFAGFKNQDGSITEGTTDLDSKWTLDCSAAFDMNVGRMTVPWAPFYAPTASVKPGLEASMDIGDEPGGGAVRLQRRNSLRDRWNFLLCFDQVAEFLTYLVVIRPDGKHAPVEGFTWRYQRTINMFWTHGRPKIQGDSGSASLIERGIQLKEGDQRLALLSNADLGANDTFVVKVNNAINAARKGSASGYEIKEFNDYSHEVTSEMQSRFVNDFN